MLYVYIACLVLFVYTLLHLPKEYLFPYRFVFVLSRISFPSKRKQAYVITLLCVCVGVCWCVCVRASVRVIRSSFWTNLPMFTKLGVSRMLLEATSPSYCFLVPCNRWIQTELASTLAKNATEPNPFEIVLLQTTRKENNWKTVETLERAVVTLETERIKGSNPWCLWWWCN